MNKPNYSYFFLLLFFVFGMVACSQDSDESLRNFPIKNTTGNVDAFITQKVEGQLHKDSIFGVFLNDSTRAFCPQLIILKKVTISKNPEEDQGIILDLQLWNGKSGEVKGKLMGEIEFEVPSQLICEDECGLIEMKGKLISPTEMFLDIELRLGGKRKRLFCQHYFEKIGRAKDGIWIQVVNDIKGNENELLGSGISLSQDGKRIAIFSGFEKYKGRVNIWEEKDGKLEQIGQDIIGEKEGHSLGCSVSLSADGKRVAFGIPLFDRIKGQVRVYQEKDQNWSMVGKPIKGKINREAFGNYLSLSSNGKRVIIVDKDYDNYRGRVVIFEERKGKWVGVGNELLGEKENDNFGYSFSISANGKRIAISSWDKEFNKGDAKIYEEKRGQWKMIARGLNKNGIEEVLGTSVALSSDGKRIVVGSPLNNYGQAGHLKIFEEIQGVWKQVGETIKGKRYDDNTGSSLAISSDGKLVAFGSNNSNYRRGKVTVYKEITGNWYQVGKDLVGNEKRDELGRVLAFSLDGSRIALGSWTHNQNNGLVRIYKID